MALSQNQPTIPLHSQAQYVESSSQAEMLMGHNVITYQSQVYIWIFSSLTTK